MRTTIIMLILLLTTTSNAYAVDLTITVPNQATSDLVDYLSGDASMNAAQKKTWLENYIKDYLKELYFNWKLETRQATIISDANTDTNTAFGG